MRILSLVTKKKYIASGSLDVHIFIYSKHKPSQHMFIVICNSCNTMLFFNRRCDRGKYSGVNICPRCCISNAEKKCGRKLWKIYEYGYGVKPNDANFLTYIGQDKDKLYIYFYSKISDAKEWTYYSFFIEVTLFSIWQYYKVALENVWHLSFVKNISYFIVLHFYHS